MPVTTQELSSDIQEKLTDVITIKGSIGVANGLAQLNADGKVIDSEGNLVEGKVTSVNGMIGDVIIDSTAPTKQVNYKYILTATAEGQTDFTIPLASFSKDDDYHFIVQNTTALNPSRYTITNTTITLNNGVKLGTELFLTIIKDVFIDDGQLINGSQIKDGTVSLQKLSEDVATQAELDAHTHAIVTETVNGFMSKEDKVKLDGIEENATNYVHPATHSPSVIAQDENNRFVSDAKIDEWDAKSTFSGSFDDLTNKPVIPTVDVDKAYVDSGLATKANSADLSSHTSNTEIHVTTADKANWNGKSNFSGNYDDLSNKPAIPTVPPINNTVTSTSTTETASANAVKTAYDRAELAFTQANDIKSKWATVIGSPLVSSDTQAQMEAKTQTIKNSLAINLTNKEQPSSGTEALEGLVSKVANIQTGFKYGLSVDPNNPITIDINNTIPNGSSMQTSKAIRYPAGFYMLTTAASSKCWGVGIAINSSFYIYLYNYDSTPVTLTQVNGYIAIEHRI